ncbi:precorrin-2 C(20)-methyltransferase [Porphyromonas sp.]|uniref:precorrin-2 C(20)-methyltransferase n=1 Tax=Porphyromonas sp. TaxID=1924944 RepID=UPI0026DC90F5|nr:precorrin-2 C(20)-methyltransferase [Porphyromonas sp.]MDO4771806.1 precorrin-2 C(20)-methyltransferase [Porphyromonas sp.]
MMTKSPICVSLGPGDPELITLKSLRILQTVQRIYCPGTTVKGKTLSRSLDIMSELGIDTDKITLFSVPMSKDRGAAEEAYLQVAKDIKSAYEQGLYVAFVAEGDCGFYSSAHYISDYLFDMGVETERVPGVPAFIACGALARLHIVKQDEILNVVPSDITLERVTNILDEGGTIVLMKLSLHEEPIKQIIKTCREATFHYFENAGLPEKEFYSTDKNTILDRKYPYFSIMIIKR